VTGDVTGNGLPDIFVEAYADEDPTTGWTDVILYWAIENKGEEGFG